MDYTPKEGDNITVELPGERTRAVIEKVVSPTACIVKLQTFTTSREHGYHRGDLVPCRLLDGAMNRKTWQGVEDDGKRVGETTEREIPLPELTAMG